MRELNEYDFDQGWFKWGGRDRCDRYYLTATEVLRHRGHDCAIGRWIGGQSDAEIDRLDKSLWEERHRRRPEGDELARAQQEIEAAEERDEIERELRDELETGAARCPPRE
jgi:hypothetical protein